MRTAGAARKEPIRSAGRTPAGGSRWLEVALRVAVADAERLGALLVDAGSMGVITGVQELARGARRRTHETVRGFFPSGDPIRARLAVQAVVNRLARPVHVHWLELDARLWEMDWRVHFQPIRAGRSLVVVPPWDRARHGERRRIVIHPGMAFGTGQHATTLACLEAIEDLTATPPARALDLGTGTGVLALALARRGVRRVHAIDTDPQAVAAARDNVRRNRLGERIQVSSRPLRAPARRYPLAVANIYVDALIALEPTLAASVAPGGHLVTSGVLRTQQGSLRKAYAPGRWRLARARRLGSWVTTIFERRRPDAPPARPRARGRAGT